MSKFPGLPDIPPSSDFEALFREAERDIVKAALKRHILTQLRDGNSVGPMSARAIEKHGPELFQKVSSPGLSNFITISAKDGIDPVLFANAIPKLLSKKGLEFEGEAKWVLEQRATEGQVPYGWHIHLLLKFTAHMAKSQRSRLIYQGLAKYLTAQNYVQIDPLKTDVDVSRALNYMNGNKPSEKMDKVRHDELQRNLLGLPKIFSITA